MTHTPLMIRLLINTLITVFLAILSAAQAAAQTDIPAVKAEPLHQSANLSYQVRGKRYYPLRKIKKFSQKGQASWYGRPFHGRKTANGEIFNMHRMTAAHRTLPIPSYIRVTNLANGKSVILRVNDRGPFHSNRILDVSKAAAEKLDFIRRGTTKVHIEQLIPDKKSRPAAQKTKPKSKTPAPPARPRRTI